MGNRLLPHSYDANRILLIDPFFQTLANYSNLSRYRWLRAKYKHAYILSGSCLYWFYMQNVIQSILQLPNKTVVLSATSIFFAVMSIYVHIHRWKRYCIIRLSFVSLTDWILSPDGTQRHLPASASGSKYRDAVRAANVSGSNNWLKHCVCHAGE